MQPCPRLPKLRSRTGPSIEPGQLIDHSFFPPSEGGKNESRSCDSRFYSQSTPREFKRQKSGTAANAFGALRIFALFLAFFSFPFAQSALADSATNATLWLIPHTHWEGAVFKTREEYLEMGLPNILTAIRLLKEHPNYRFTLDQVAYFRPFLERYPEEAGAFRKFVSEGRLQIVCGLNIM